MGGLIFNLQVLEGTLMGNGENYFNIMGNGNPLTWKVLEMEPNREIREKVSLREDKLRRKDSQTLKLSLFSMNFCFFQLWSPYRSNSDWVSTIL